MKQLRIALKTLFTKTELYLINHNRKFLAVSNPSQIFEFNKSPKHKLDKAREQELGPYFKFLLQDCGLGVNQPYLKNKSEAKPPTK